MKVRGLDNFLRDVCSLLSNGAVKGSTAARREMYKYYLWHILNTTAPTPASSVLGASWGEVGGWKATPVTYPFRPATTRGHN